VFQLADMEVPAEWSQVACDILAQKYFRKAGIPARLKPVEETDVPAWLWRRAADGDGQPTCRRPSVARPSAAPSKSSTALPGRGLLGWKGGYFDAEDDAAAYFRRDALHAVLPDGGTHSPQWFNTGLYWAYGIDGPAQGHYYVDFRTGELVASQSAYEHPQPHACFIQSVADDLVNEGGIMDLWVRERALQIRLRHRLEFLQIARRQRAPCQAVAAPPA